jgi:hypothetical protein
MTIETDRAEAELDRILGDRALFKLKSLQQFGGPSTQTLYRAAKLGIIQLVKNGSSTDLTRETAKRILLYGLGPIPFVYGKQAEAKIATAQKRAALETA